MKKEIERKRLSKTRVLLQATAAMTARHTKSRQLGVRVSEGVYKALQAAGYSESMGAGTVASLLLSAYLLPEALGERVNMTAADIAQLPQLLSALADAEKVSRSVAEFAQALREHLQNEGAKMAALALHSTDTFTVKSKYSVKLA